MLGTLHRDRGDFALARTYLHDAVKAKTDFGDTAGAVRAQISGAVLDLDLGRYDEARAALSELSDDVGHSGSTSLAWFYLAVLAALHGGEGDQLRAAQICGTSNRLRDLSGDRIVARWASRWMTLMDSLRNDLGSEAYAMCAAQGRALTLDEAVAYALGEVTWDELAPVVAERVAAGGVPAVGEGGEAVAR